MVYQIYDKDRQVLFDIEIYMKLDENAYDEYEHKYTTDKKWYVELHSDAFISRAVDYIRDREKTNLYTDEEWEMFKKDCKELEELRGWLWETHSNSPRTDKEANKDYKEWEEYVKNKVYTFAKKYGLYVNQD